MSNTASLLMIRVACVDHGGGAPASLALRRPMARRLRAPVHPRLLPIQGAGGRRLARSPSLKASSLAGPGAVARTATAAW